MDPEIGTLKDCFPLAAPVVFRVHVRFQGKTFWTLTKERIQEPSLGFFSCL